MALLRPLLLDNVPSIQQSADLALGRLASYSDELAEAVVNNEILTQLVVSLAEQNRFYKKAAAFVLRAVAKHSATLAHAVVDSGALEALVICLEEFDPSVKEAAAYALAYIAKYFFSTRFLMIFQTYFRPCKSRVRCWIGPTFGPLCPGT